jgi:two-component system, NtrC family, response regulator
MDRAPLLLVDDDPEILRMLRWSFEGYDLYTASNRGEALQQIGERRPAVVTLDLGLPPAPDDASEGLAILEEILAIAPETKVIVVTGNDERETAVKAVGLGAYDYYQKPIEPRTLGLVVERAFRLTELEAANRRSDQRSGTSALGITTASEKMLKLCRTVEKVAATNATVLLLGESGTGKELLAQAIHNQSPRRDRSFVVINCGAIPETLLESELFGHEKGAFTGAVRQVKGKIELAQRGTLFLDEIGDMSLALQVKLLRFLQERTIERIGGREKIAVDTRIVCATNRNLREQIGRSEFREDLFYRISQVTIEIPPLRERDDDAVLLARYISDRYAQELGRKRPRFAMDAVSALREHKWPGNVRELENRVKRAVILADGPAITAADLDLQQSVAVPGHLTLRDARQQAERTVVLQALNVANGNMSEVAKILGISRPTVYSLMKDLDIKWPPT